MQFLQCGGMVMFSLVNVKNLILPPYQNITRSLTLYILYFFTEGVNHCGDRNVVQLQPKFNLPFYGG